MMTASRTVRRCAWILVRDDPMTAVDGSINGSTCEESQQIDSDSSPLTEFRPDQPRAEADNSSNCNGIVVQIPTRAVAS
jgi:hypothetical protein